MQRTSASILALMSLMRGGRPQLVLRASAREKKKKKYHETNKKKEQLKSKNTAISNLSHNIKKSDRPTALPRGV
jgi:hypothetical protein